MWINTKLIYKKIIKVKFFLLETRGSCGVLQEWFFWQFFFFSLAGLTWFLFPLICRCRGAGLSNLFLYRIFCKWKFKGITKTRGSPFSPNFNTECFQTGSGVNKMTETLNLYSISIYLSIYILYSIDSIVILAEKGGCTSNNY